MILRTGLWETPMFRLCAGNFDQDTVSVQVALFPSCLTAPGSQIQTLRLSRFSSAITRPARFSSIWAAWFRSAKSTLIHGISIIRLKPIVTVLSSVSHSMATLMMYCQI